MIRLTIPTVCLILFSCNFNYSSDAKTGDEKVSKSAMELSKKALRHIEQDKVDSLLSLLNSKVRQMIKPDQIDWLMKEGRKAITNSTFPSDTSVLVSQSVNFSITGKRVIETLSFPFQSKEYKDSIKYFHITVADNEIHRLFFNNYPPGMRIIEPERKEPHLTTLNLNSKNVSWFRIWYEDGSKISNRYGFHSDYFAVSGNNEKLDKLGISKSFQEIFDLINKAVPDSLDFKYLREKEIGNAEEIYLRIKFSNAEYQNLGEFEIACFLDEEDGKKEILSEYIVFKHTDNTRYLFRKDKNMGLFQKLKELARRDFKDSYEINP